MIDPKLSNSTTRWNKKSNHLPMHRITCIRIIHIFWTVFFGLILGGMFLAAGCGRAVIESSPASRAKSPEYTKGKRLAETAKSQIGSRYRWGGTSPKRGFDCSGLAWWTARKNGINIPRKTTDQWRSGSPVKNGLLPGDLVFFKISWTGSLHVGVYLGKGQFVHSPKSGGRVRTDSIHQEYWRERFIGARRIV